MSLAASPTATSSFTVNSGAQLLLTGAGTYTLGSGPLNFNGTGAFTGPFAAFPGAMRNDRGAAITNIVILNAVVLQSDTLIHVQALTGTGAAASPGGTNTLAGDISGPGRLTLTAPNSDADQGVLILSGTNNTYAGGSFVNGGILVANGVSSSFGTGNVTVNNAASPSSIARISIETGVTNAIADTATLSLAGGNAGFAILGTGVNEVVAALSLGGATQGPGTYGSTASSAAVQNDIYFSGTGIITVPASEALPLLTITLAAPNAILSWPTNATGFTLQELAAFPPTSPPYAWTDVNTNITPVVVSGTNNTVTVPASSGNDFFRLKK
jgi:autotransporter-associated beta strand protein